MSEITPILGAFFCKNCGRILLMEHGYCMLDEDYSKHLKLSGEIMDDFEEKGMYLIFTLCPICVNLVPARQEAINRIVKRRNR